MGASGRQINTQMPVESSLTQKPSGGDGVGGCRDGKAEVAAYRTQSVRGLHDRLVGCMYRGWCGRKSGGRDAMGLREERHAGRCPGLSIRTLHAAPMMAAAPTAAAVVGRRLLCRFPPSPPTIGGWVGRPPSATVSRDHTSFVRVVWMEAARRPKRRPVWSSSPLLSSPLCPTAPRAPSPPSVPLHSWHKTKDGSPFSAEPTKGAQKGDENERGRYCLPRRGSRCEWGN